MADAYASSLEKVREAVISGALISKGDRVLCALSGGADSVALLVFLSELSSELSFEVFAAHLNHGIRGDEADRDEAYCDELCKGLGIPLEVGHANIPEEAKKSGKSLETCARDIRYDFLRSTARRLGCAKICTAHHADDNIETVLLHMIRGSGLGGLTGIAPMRGDLIRPLLTLRKNELVDALREKGIGFVFDSTNDSTDHARNYIRHNILPHIYSLNESADKAFYRMCRSLSEDSGLLASEASRIKKDASLAELSALPDPILKRFISLRYAELMGEGSCPDNAALTLLKNAVKEFKGALRYDISGGVTAYISHSGIHLEKTGNTNLNPEDYLIPLSYGENFISQTGYSIFITSDKKVADEWKNIYKLSTLWCVNSDKITNDGKLCLFARNGREGDSYKFGGFLRDAGRQLKKFKLPVHQRSLLPRITAGDELIGVWGLPVADSYRAVRDGQPIYICCKKQTN